MYLGLLVFSKISLISTSFSLPLPPPSTLTISHLGFLGKRLEWGLGVQTGIIHSDVTLLTPLSHSASMGLIYRITIMSQYDSPFRSQFFLAKSFGETYRFSQEASLSQSQSFLTEQRWNYWHDLWRSTVGVKLSWSPTESPFDLKLGFRHSTPWWLQQPGSGFDYSKVRLGATTIGVTQELGSWAWEFRIHHIHAVVAQTRVSFWLPAVDVSLSF